MMTRKDAASLFRIVVAEARRAPKPGAIFYTQGPGTTLKRLAKYLRAAADRGGTAADRGGAAADPGGAAARPAASFPSVETMISRRKMRFLRKK